MTGSVGNDLHGEIRIVHHGGLGHRIVYHAERHAQSDLNFLSDIWVFDEEDFGVLLSLSKA